MKYLVRGLAFVMLIGMVGVVIPQLALAAAEGGYKIIVNNANSVDSVSREDLAKMFLKKITKWDDGSAVAPVDLPEDNDVRELFSEGVLKKNAMAVRSYWQRIIFSGKGVPPVTRDASADVVIFVKENSGAVGYVSTDTDVSGVTVIEVTD